MIRPHGGHLINRELPQPRRERAREEAQGMTSVTISLELAKEAENIALGVFSPLEGFMTSDEVTAIREHMRLPDDTPWTLPILLHVSDEEVGSLKAGDDVALRLESGEPVALMNVEDSFKLDKKALARDVFRTDEMEHPGVAKLMSLSDNFIGGKIDLIQDFPTPYSKYHLRPTETRLLFKEKGWSTIVAFQTRNPPHVGHEYVQKSALTFVDGLLINPVIGRKKRGDFKDEVILDAYDALIKGYYPQDRAVMTTLETEMRYAGPREAIFHSIVRKNYGCTHFIVGRDHAGVGNYYGHFDAHAIFDDFPDLDIKPMFFRSFYYCKRCCSPVNDKVCPHSGDDVINFSGTMVRKIVNTGELPPVEMMRPEVAEVIKGSESPFVE